jgi:hypothetical protein
MGRSVKESLISNRVYAQDATSALRYAKLKRLKARKKNPSSGLKQCRSMEAWNPGILEYYVNPLFHISNFPSFQIS